MAWVGAQVSPLPNIPMQSFYVERGQEQVLSQSRGPGLSGISMWDHLARQWI